MDDLLKIIINYYEKRGLKWPSFDNAMKFALTEIGEVYEVDLARYKGWVRNNPDGKPVLFDKERLGDELGDVIMMIMVAGIVEEVDPLAHLVRKINVKLRELEDE